VSRAGARGTQPHVSPTFDPPLLLVVSGPPASGKTSVAEELARRLRVPFVSKDAFKERLYETFGSRDDLEQRIEEAALAMLYDVAGAQLDAGVSVMAESNFDRRSDLEPLRRLQRRHGARIVQVHCTRSKEKLLERFVGRIREGDRHPGHGDEPEDVDDVERKLDEGVWEPLPLDGELLEVDKDDAAFDHDALAEGVRELVAR
jgi:predicted kinase